MTTSGSNTQTLVTQVLRLESPNAYNDVLSAIRERVNDRNYNFPVIPDFEDGTETMDADLIRTINADENLLEVRTNIMENLSQGIHDENVIRLLVSQATPDIRNLLTEISGNRQVGNIINVITPVFNIIAFGSIGLEDFNTVFLEISRAIMETDSDNSIIEQDNQEIMRSRLRVIDQENNMEINEIRREHNEERSNFFRNNWRTYARRGFNLFLSTLSAYAISTEGRAEIIRILSSLVGSERVQNLWINPFSSITRPTTWNDVSNAFWGSWGTFTRFMADRSRRG